MYAALLTWTYALSDKTGYLLQRSTDSGSSWTVNYALASTASSYIDSAVALTNTYWYRIAATNNYGTGAYSNTGSVFIPYGLPNPPSLLGVTSGSAILAWTPGTPDSSHSIHDFFAVRKSTDGNIFSDFGVSLIASFTDTDVTSSVTGNTYWYAVAAVNVAGTSSFSNTGSILFQDIPMGPTNLQVSSGSAVLTWNSGSTGQDYFALQRSTDGVNFSDLAAPVLETYTDATVIGDYVPQSYWYRVGAVDEAGTSSFSNTASITFSWLPPAPYSLIVNSGSAQVSWSFNSISAPTTFSLERSTDGLIFSELTTTPSKELVDGTVVAGPGAGNTYWYRVAAFTSVGTSSFTDSASINFIYDPPAAPMLLPVESGSAVFLYGYCNGANQRT